jgi:hypothetical protein
MSPANFLFYLFGNTSIENSINNSRIDIRFRCLLSDILHQNLIICTHLYSCLTHLLLITIHFDIALLTGLSISAVLSKFNPTAFLSNGWKLLSLLDNSPSFVLVLSMVPLIVILELLVNQLYHQYLQLVSASLFFC